MNIAQSTIFAWRGVTANKSRSVLTMLMVLIGVASVIILVAVGTGASASVSNTLNSLGTNTLTVSTDTDGGGGVLGGADGPPLPGGGGEAEPSAEPEGGDPSTGSAQDGTRVRPATLTLEDAEALGDPRQAPDVLAVAPVVSPAAVTATFRGVSHTVGTTTGSTAAYLGINNDSVAAGRAFGAADYTAHTRVAVLGVTVAEELAGGDGSGILDQTIDLNGKAFTVVGILTAKGSAGPQDQDDRVLAPATAVQDTISGYESLTSISVKAASAEAVDAAQGQVESILDSRHGTTAATRDFSVDSSASFIEAASSITGIFTLLLGAIAAISLLVGGIGVMNIMLVTVTERTREIGIRKAIGAGRGDIIGQFLIEAIMLSMFGGIAGITFGILVAQVEVGGFQLIVAPYSVVLAFSFAVAVGLIFGLYPALRAARLQPVDALRYE